MLIRVIIWCVLMFAATAGAETSAIVIAHWKLNGDLHDSASPAHDAIRDGRGEFVDSPVCAPGKALWFNGVDTIVRAAAIPDAGAGDFSISLWFCPLEMQPGGLIGRGDAPHGWSVELLPNRAVRFRVGAKTVDSVPDRVAFGQWYHLAAVAHPGGKMTLYINGEPAASADLGTNTGSSADAVLIGRSSEKGPLFTGLLDDVRLFNQAIDADAVAKLTDAGLPWLRARASAQTPFGGHFALANDDVVVLVGGEDQNAAQHAGYLETILTAGSPGKNVLFRDMAWEGDTVFEQWRILNFGPWSKQFERVGASVIFVQFGQMESLKGKAGVDEFAAAYERLLNEFERRTRRIVVISPTPFQKTAPPMPDLTTHSDDLQLYADAAKKLADKHGLLYVDLLSPLQQSQLKYPLARDGEHLTTFGHWIAARETARQLGFSATDPVTSAEDPKFERKELEQLRESIVEKNALWSRYWRPTNWAFLAGDRITQPSSRDYRDSRVRWQPAEAQQYAPHIAGEEEKIAQEAKALRQP